MRKQKQASKDFTVEDLPHNRVEVFFDCLKQRYDVWFKIGVTLVIFMAPWFILKVVADTTYSNMLEEGELSKEMILSFKEYFALINIIPLLIMSIGFAGIMKVIRQLVWGEGVFFFQDFKSGIKQNYFAYIIIFLVYGLLKLLFIYIECLIPIEIVDKIPTALAIVLLLPTAMYALQATVIYKDNLLKILGNSVKFYIKSAPLSLAFVVILAASFCVEYINIVALRYTLIAIFIFVFLPMYLIAWSLFANTTFDKLVNVTLYPEYVDKGVFRLGKDIKDETNKMS